LRASDYVLRQLEYVHYAKHSEQLKSADITTNCEEIEGMKVDRACIGFIFGAMEKTQMNQTLRQQASQK